MFTTRWLLSAEERGGRWAVAACNQSKQHLHFRQIAMIEGIPRRQGEVRGGGAVPGFEAHDKGRHQPSGCGVAGETFWGRGEEVAPAAMT